MLSVIQLPFLGSELDRSGSVRPTRTWCHRRRGREPLVWERPITKTHGLRSTTSCELALYTLCVVGTHVAHRR
jgi:hypothetical protein